MSHILKTKYRYKYVYAVFIFASISLHSILAIDYRWGLGSLYVGEEPVIYWKIVKALTVIQIVILVMGSNGRLTRHLRRLASMARIRLIGIVSY